MALDISKTRKATAEPLAAHPVQKLELQCGSCGYGIVVERAPMTCPMCHQEAWETVPWRPFTRLQ